MPRLAKPTGIKECTIKRMEVFARQFEIDDSGCWLWKGHISKGGYGQTAIKNKQRLAHRVMWELTGNSVDSRLQLDHLCKVRHCINPKHLEQVTAMVNVSRGDSPSAISKRTNLCIRGHLLTGDNLRIVTCKSRPPTRKCITCWRKYDAEFHRKARQLKKILTVDDKSLKQITCQICNYQYHKRAYTRHLMDFHGWTYNK